jgi:predicted pyridoxine 5'-phosphate oxidase superfamily flavin-nucleotide-binding protein
VLEPDVIRLLESSESIDVVGTVDASGVPDATRAWGLRVLDDRQRVRMLLAAAAGTALANLAATSVVAVTATDVRTLDSVQVKGRAVHTEPATDEDRRDHDAYFAALRLALHEVDGTSSELLDRMRPGPLVAVVASVDAIYDQTPGPAAGSRLAPSLEGR